MTTLHDIYGWDDPVRDDNRFTNMTEEERGTLHHALKSFLVLTNDTPNKFQMTRRIADRLMLEILDSF